MGIYYGEPEGFIIRHKVPTTITEHECPRCNGTGKISTQNYIINEKKYKEKDWFQKMQEYISSEQMETIDSFGFIAQMSSTYGSGNSTGVDFQYYSDRDGSFTDWWERNKQLYNNFL
jgi:hypothetical protein